MYLFDTNILSEGAPRKRQSLTFGDLANWLDAAADHLWVSVMTIAEIASGIERSAIRGEHRKAARLRAWLEVVEHLYDPCILPLCRNAARLSGSPSARARMAGASPGFADAAVAATAELHALRILTRNVKDFAPIGATVINPYESGLPPTIRER